MKNDTIKDLERKCIEWIITNFYGLYINPKTWYIIKYEI